MIPFVAEKISSLVKEHIEQNLNNVINQINAERSDDVVLENLDNEVFIYEKARGYRSPAVWAIIDSIEFTKKEKQGNFIDATARIIVSVLCEERNSKLLTIKSFRFQSALQRILDYQVLTSADNRAKLSLIVTGCEFSPVFSNAKDNEEGVFRKEVSLEIEGYYFEDFN